MMHSEDRERAILAMLEGRGFVSFRELDKRLKASAATLRRDLSRMETAGQLVRVHGGAKIVEAGQVVGLSGIPFQENITKNAEAKAAIGRAAAAMCAAGDSIIIDGGSTTLQMCAHIGELGLQVLTNSLHIASSLLPQIRTHLYITSGAVFREQNIILSPFEDDGTSYFHASKMFMGASSVGKQGLMQTDLVLLQAERRLIARAASLVLLVDSSKFQGPAGHIVCALKSVSTLVTDKGISAADARLVESTGVRLVVAK